MNMKLIDRNDPQYFTHTSLKPYDRHKYKLIFSDGHTVILNDYEQVREAGFNHGRLWRDVRVEVVDVKKGFK